MFTTNHKLSITQQLELENKFPSGRKIICNKEIYTVSRYNLDLDLRILATKSSDGTLWYLDPDDCSYYIPQDNEPVLRISLEDFIDKYKKDITLTTELKGLNFMINRYTKDGYFDNDLIQEFVDYYAQTILPIQEFNFHIDPEDGHCHLSFPYQLGKYQLEISLQDFHFIDRFNLATAEDVFNLICDFQLEVQRVRHDLEFKKY